MIPLKFPEQSILKMELSRRGNNRTSPPLKNKNDLKASKYNHDQDYTPTSKNVDSYSSNIQQEHKISLWKEGPYAAGLVEVSWNDERTKYSKIKDYLSEDENHTCKIEIMSSYICPLFNAGRIGNMIILKDHIDEITNERVLDIVVGPYWFIAFFVTFPIILIFSLWIGRYAVFISDTSPMMKLFWLVLFSLLIYFLFKTSCKDPGILKRCLEQPIDDKSNFWIWNEDAQSYRPQEAKYDVDCAVIIDGLDHTCPWTGTAIGKGNIKSFQGFVAMVFINLIMDCLLLSGSLK